MFFYILYCELCIMTVLYYVLVAVRKTKVLKKIISRRNQFGENMAELKC